jgi:hypothetical protein
MTLICGSARGRHVVDELERDHAVGADLHVLVELGVGVELDRQLVADLEHIRLGLWERMLRQHRIQLGALTAGSVREPGLGRRAPGASGEARDECERDDHRQRTPFHERRPSSEIPTVSSQPILVILILVALTTPPPQQCSRHRTADAKAMLFESLPE